MSFEPLRRSDWRLVWVAAAVVLVSAVYVRFNYYAAFPQASVELRFTKQEINERAAAFLAERGYSTEGFRQLTLFDGDTQAQIYLERELGLEEANRVMAGPVSVWRWRARWFRPPDREEFLVRVSPDGRVVGFEHLIEEAAPGARLDRDTAFAIAETFLGSMTSEPHRLVEEQTEERPNRLDHIFTWEREGFQAGDATYRRRITVQGDEVGGYTEYLHVPEQWEREFAALRSGNETYQWIAEALFAALGVAAVVALFVWLRRRELPWRALVLLSAAVGALTVLSQLNLLPFVVDALPTSTGYPQMVVFAAMQAMGAGVGVFFYVIIAAAAGEPLYRRAQPSHLSIVSMVSRHGVRTREFFRATVAGYGFAAGHIAFVVAFYLLGQQAGVWAPQDVRYSDLLSTAVPWIYPVAVSVLASTSEEFWFRLLAIPLLQRYLKSTWIAVILPAFVWGFLHSNYPQQPGYVRGIEVGLIGIAAGFLMLRYGILATLIWHFTVDAVFIGMFLFQTESWTYRANGLIVAAVVALPLLVSLFFYRRNGGFLAEEQLTNAAMPPAPPPEPTVVEPVAEPLTAKLPARWLYAAGGVALIAGLLASPFLFGDFAEVRLSASDANRIAGEELGERGVNTDDWMRVTTFIPNLLVADFEYVRRLEGNEAANEAVRDHTITAVWSVRYFQPLRSEEWRVYVNQGGVAYRVDHVLDEHAAGAELASDEARGLAEAYLTGPRDVALDEFRLVNTAAEQRDARTDHDFVWERDGFQIGDAAARMSLSVVGDEVSRYRRYLKLPEQWLREFQRPRLRSFIVPSLAGAIGLPLLILLIRRLSSGEHRYRWKLYIGAGAAATALTAAGVLNSWPVLMASYGTVTPFANWLGQEALRQLISVGAVGLGLVLLVLAADVFLQRAIGYRKAPRASWVRALAVACLIAGVVRTLAWIGQLIPGDRFSLDLWSVSGADTLLPAFAVLEQAALAGAAFLALMVIACSVFAWMPRQTGYRFAVAGALLVAVARSSSLWLLLFQFAAGLVVIALIWFLARTNGADLATLGVALFWVQAVGPALTLAEQPSPWLASNGYAALAVALLAGALLLRLRPLSGNHAH